MSDSFAFVDFKEPGKWCIHVHIQPKAKKTQVSGEYGNSLKLRVQAPPVDNKANTAAAVFLAEKLGLKKKAVYIYKGSKTREKIFMIETKREPEWSVLFNQ